MYFVLADWCNHVSLYVQNINYCPYWVTISFCSLSIFFYLIIFLLFKQIQSDWVWLQKKWNTNGNSWSKTSTGLVLASRWLHPWNLRWRGTEAFLHNLSVCYHAFTFLYSLLFHNHVFSFVAYVMNILCVEGKRCQADYLSCMILLLVSEVPGLIHCSFWQLQLMFLMIFLRLFMEMPDRTIPSHEGTTAFFCTFKSFASCHIVVFWLVT